MTETAVLPARVAAARARRAARRRRRLAAVARTTTDRLLARLAAAHDRLHTHHGVRTDDRSRRHIVEHGILARAVHRELVARGVTPSPCSFCNPEATSAD